MFWSRRRVGSSGELLVISSRSNSSNRQRNVSLCCCVAVFGHGFLAGKSPKGSCLEWSSGPAGHVWKKRMELVMGCDPRWPKYDQRFLFWAEKSPLFTTHDLFWGVQHQLKPISVRYISTTCCFWIPQLHDWYMTCVRSLVCSWTRSLSMRSPSHFTLFQPLGSVVLPYLVVGFNYGVSLYMTCVRSLVCSWMLSRRTCHMEVSINRGYPWLPPSSHSF